MRHLSTDRVVAVAEGSRPRRGEEEHVASCAACARRIKETAALLAMVHQSHDPQVPPERWEESAARIGERIAATRPRHRRLPSLRWTMVPLAAALVAVLLPGVRDSTQPAEPVASHVRVQNDLDTGEFDTLVQNLATATADLGVADAVLSRGVSHWSEIGEMSRDELMGLLDAMGTNGYY